MEDTESKHAIFCTHVTLCVVGLDCICMSIWLKVTHGNLKTTQIDGWGEGFSLKTDIGSLLSRTTSTEDTEHEGGQTDAYIDIPYLHSSFFGTGRYAEGYGKRNLYQHNHKTLIYNVSCLQDVLAKDLWDSGQSMSGLTMRSM